MERISRKEVPTNIMATSYAIYKKEITDYLKQNFQSNATILDVGAGEGTYLPYLNDYFYNIDAVEIFEPNIINYNLKDSYRNVYCIDIKDFEYKWYDIIIFGDVIEHLTVQDAQTVLKYACARSKVVIVAVPYLSSQGIEENNIYEIHKQDDLTDRVMKQRYPFLKLVFKNDIYGYYIKEESMKNYFVKAIRNFDDVEEKNEKGLNTPRIANNSTWYCTKERYEFLKEHNAVVLIGIEKQESKQVQVESEATTEPVEKVEIAKKDKPKKKNTKK